MRGTVHGLALVVGQGLELLRQRLGGGQELLVHGFAHALRQAAVAGGDQGRAGGEKVRMTRIECLP
ncbi:hypothetical protein D3C85_1888900 [compost metagenome]